MKRYKITIECPKSWIEDATDLLELLEKDCNIWNVTHCEPDIEVEELEQ